MNKSTSVICSECGKGNYVVAGGGAAPDFHCTMCSGEMNWSDFEGNGSEGESLVVIDGLLYVVTAQS